MLEQVTPTAGLRPNTASARAATILSVATELPPTRLTSAELADRLGITEEWILARTGIRERRQAADHERLTDYAARAGAGALDAAGVHAEDLDLVIVGTMTSDELTPNTAPLVAHALGARRAGAFDLGAACMAFLSGLSVGAAQIETGRAERVLLIGADFITRITNYEDRRSAPLFADAAGAVVLGAGDGGPGAIGPIVLGADGSHGHAITAAHEDRKLQMDGTEVYRHAVARMSEVTLEAVARAGLTLDRDRPVRLPPGQRADHARARRAARAAERAGRRLHRVARQRLRRDAPRGARHGAAGRPAPARSARSALRVRRRLHVGGRRDRMGGGVNGCALVTGASRGIGAAIAVALARDGWPVGVNYRTERERAAEVVDSITSEGGRAMAVAGDVSDPRAPDALFDGVGGGVRRSRARSHQQCRHRPRRPRADARR